MTALQELESQEKEAWDAYLTHSQECPDCQAWYVFCVVADKLLSKVRDLRDTIGWGPR